MMISSVVSRLSILTFGTLYPAYASFKAVRAKNVSEYVKWMMYWIVFAIFSCIETFTDLFLPWFPFYYEIKVVLVLWLLSPATNGSSILYRKFVHPLLKRKEPEIDGYIVRVRQQGYATIVQLLTQAIQHVRIFVMNIIHRNFTSGLIIMNENLMRSSVSDGSLNQRHFFGDNNGEMPRSKSLHFLHRQDLIITEESFDDDSMMSGNLEDLEEVQQPASSTRSKTVSKTRKAAANKNVVAVRRGRGRKAKEAITDSVSEGE